MCRTKCVDGCLNVENCWTGWQSHRSGRFSDYPHLVAILARPIKDRKCKPTSSSRCRVAPSRPRRAVSNCSIAILCDAFSSRRRAQRVKDPCGSKSNVITFSPVFAAATARDAASVVFPDPPLPRCMELRREDTTAFRILRRSTTLSDVTLPCPAVFPRSGSVICDYEEDASPGQTEYALADYVVAGLLDGLGRGDVFLRDVLV
jgi:hypothetical protein